MKIYDAIPLKSLIINNMIVKSQTVKLKKNLAAAVAEDIKKISN